MANNNASPRVFTTLAEVKNTYFPNRELESLEKGFSSHDALLRVVKKNASKRKSSPRKGK
jgi:hypothetical protein